MTSTQGFTDVNALVLVHERLNKVKCIKMYENTLQEKNYLIKHSIFYEEGVKWEKKIVKKIKKEMPHVMQRPWCMLLKVAWSPKLTFTHPIHPYRYQPP